MDSPNPREPLWTSTTSCCLPRPTLLERAGVEDLLNGLQLGEVIATTDGAERRIELRGLQIVFGEEAIRRTRPTGVRG